MPDDFLILDGKLEGDALLTALRQKEDLFFKLVSMETDPVTGQNRFGFDVQDPAIPLLDSDFLNLHPEPSANDDQTQSALRTQFSDFGGSIVLSGLVRIAETVCYSIFHRGPKPELPAPHAPSIDPVPPELPGHVQSIFAAGGELAGIPWNDARPVKLSLAGLKNRTIQVFADGPTGTVKAFVMMTDADIDTDGPGGSKIIDRFWQKDTKLNFADGTSCDSRRFPGVVRSLKLADKSIGLRMGDYCYICYNGRFVACQIYDQGPTDKIGEISDFAGREVGGIPRDASQSFAANSGNFADEHLDLVTICFPGSSQSNQAESLATIKQETRAAFERFVAGRASVSLAANPPPPPVVAPAAPTGPLTIYRRSAWRALKPKVTAFTPRDSEAIVIHNTEDPNRSPEATPAAEVDVAMELSRRIQRSHMFDRGWSDIGQHFTISRGGIVMEARAGSVDAVLAGGQVVQGAHAGVARYNNHAWGIELEGDYRVAAAAPTTAQKQSLLALATWLGSKIGSFNAGNAIFVHRQVKPGGTDCPGHLLDPAAPADFLAQVRTAVAQALSSGTPPNPTLVS